MRNVGSIDGIEVHISHHALARMVEMGLSGEEIKLLISDPENVYASRKYPGDICHERGSHVLAMRREGSIIVVKTALYATLVDWMKAERDGLLPADRKLKMDTSIPRFK